MLPVVSCFRDTRTSQLSSVSWGMCFLSVIEWMPTRQTAAILRTHVACGTRGTIGPILRPVLVSFGIELNRSIKLRLVSIIRCYSVAAYCYRPSSVVCRSVCQSVTLVSPAKTAAPLEMPFGLRTRVGPRNHVLGRGPDPLMGRGSFDEGKGHPLVKYKDTLRSPVRIRLNRSRCCLGCGLGWAIGIMC